MTEVPPVVTDHQITVDGKALKYTATAGRLPIKRGDGKIEAEMFYVAYTLDGQDAAKRPLTFAFNGGPGSASIWLHMGALGPRKVVLKPHRRSRDFPTWASAMRQAIVKNPVSEDPCDGRLLFGPRHACLRRTTPVDLNLPQKYCDNISFCEI